MQNKLEFDVKKCLFLGSINWEKGKFLHEMFVILCFCRRLIRSSLCHMWSGRDHSSETFGCFPDVLVELKQYFLIPNPVGFVSEPNRTISTKLSQHTIEKLRIK